MSLRQFLPIYLVVYSFAAFFWRSYTVWKKTGVNPVVFKGSDSAHDFVGRLFKLLFALIVVVVTLYSLSPAAYSYTKPFQLLEHNWIKMVGVILLLLSLGWTIVSQAQMGQSWRIGIDTENATSLVQAGVFRFSRNPIFLGMMLTLLGLFLTIPNALTLLTFVLGVALIGVQVRLEEEYLLRTHGDEYRRYCQRVRRWI